MSRLTDLFRDSRRSRLRSAARLKWGCSLALALPLALGAAEPPANDYFTNRIHLSSAAVLTNGHNRLATREPGDPTTVGQALCNATVWWSWTGPGTGRYAAVIMMPAPAQPALWVYTGSPATGLVAVAEFGTLNHYTAVRDGTNCNVFQVLFNATAGTEYAIIAGAEYPHEGPFELAITRPPSIAWNQPVNRGDVPAGSDVSFDVTVGAGERSVEVVEYSIYPGQIVTQSTQAPWHGVWSNAPIGRYFQLTARAVDDFGASAAATIEMSVGRPPNDDFADRIVLSGLPVVTNGPFYAAGTEPGEYETIGYYRRSRTVWWNWTAPSNGTYAILATATNPVLVGVYTGAQINTLSLQTFRAGTHAAFIGGQYRYCSQAMLEATAGVTYQIVVDGGGWAPYEVGLAITLPPRVQLTSPTNGSVFPWFSPIPFSAEVSDLDGTIQQVEFMEIHTVPGSGWSVPLGTVTQAPWSLVTSQASSGSYPVMARVTDDLGAQAVGTNRIWVGVPRPVNDDFSGRITIPNTGTNLSVSGSNRWASAETGELYAQRSVWWSWTAPASGAITINTCGSTLNADLRIYTGVGPTISNLTLFSGASGGACASLTYAAVAGTTYHIVVDGVGGDQSQIILNLLTPVSPQVRLNPVRDVTNGAFGFSFPAVPGQRSIVEISTNLLHWTPVKTNDFAGEAMYFSDPGCTGAGQRFYRVHQE